MTVNLIIEHMFLVLAAITMAIIIGIPLGICAYMVPKSKTIILRIVDILQTIPALALLGLIMILAGPGKLTVVIGITLYSLLPIVQNTYVGLSGIDTGVKEAAKGVGMTPGERLGKVEFSIAFPTIFTGIRIAVVNAIGIAVFAAFVGGGGLGGVMNKAIRIQDMKMILLATGALMIIAVVLDLIMSISEAQIRKFHSNMKRVISSILIVFVAFLATVPFQLAGAKSADAMMLYDGDYTESQIMHHMIKHLVEGKTDLKVSIQDQMSQVNNYKALIGDRHSCDMMISYDGTLLTTFLKKDPTDVPKGESLYDYTNKLGQEKEQVTMLGKLGFNNTYAIAVPQKIADKYNLKKVSDLEKVSKDLVFGAEHEFFTEEGSMKYNPFIKYYNLKFKDQKSVDVSLKYSAVEKGEYDVTEVYATDGLNKKANLLILEDDKHFFPEYNGAFLVREDTFEKFASAAPNLRQVLSMLNGKISTEEMSELTYLVDVKGQSLDRVSEDFLKKKGIL